MQIRFIRISVGLKHKVKTVKLIWYRMCVDFLGYEYDIRVGLKIGDNPKPYGMPKY